MRKVFSLIMAVWALAACHKIAPQETLVNWIEFDSKVYKLFPGDEKEVNLLCYPSNATNLEELTVSISNSEVADFQDGKLKAKMSGTSLITASCGKVSASARVTVYSGWFTKGGTKYGVDSATGYYFTMGESSPQSMEITLTFFKENNDQEHFWAMLNYTNLGKTIDFTQDVEETLVAVYLNNNEDGYTIYGNDEGKPVIKTADWSDPGEVSLMRGLLTVTGKGNDQFAVSADFTLSNGYTFGAQWEGTANMKTE